MSVVQAKTLAKECESNADCSEGATCVAGDSETSVQRCVAGAPCGGSNIGSCPADPATGQLACIWRPDTKACSGGAASGCKQIGSEYGIYKCISLDRCDKYFGDSLCSGGCNVNGVQCNGRGNCQVSYESDVPSFQCACDSGWNGTKCDNVLNDSCVVDVGQCGTHGTCVKNACECKDGYTGEQCEIAPAGSGSLSGSMGSSNSSSNSSNSNSSSNSSSSNSTSSSPTSSSSTVVTPKPNQAGSAASNTDSVSDGKNSKSPTFILVGLLAAVIIVAALLFALYSRKKKREQDAAGGFARTGSIDEGVDGAAIAGGPDTPKQNIVIITSMDVPTRARADPVDVLFMIVKHLRLCGLSVSAMALLRESQIDTAWLCGPSHEMLLLREWVFTGDFTRAKTLLQPLASVLTAEELRGAMGLIEKQELLESFFVSDDARTHKQRQSILDELRARKRELHVDESELALCLQALLCNEDSPTAVHKEASKDAAPTHQWDVNEARMRCFERLVPFFRGEIGREDSSEHLYLSEQRHCKQSSARALPENRMLSRSVDLSRTKSNWSSSDDGDVGAAAGGGVASRMEQIGSSFKRNKRQSPLAMPLDFDKARLATRHQVSGTAGGGSRELIVEEEDDEDTDTEEGEAWVSASTLEHVEEEEHKATPLVTSVCDSATQTEPLCTTAAVSVAPSDPREADRAIRKPEDEERAPAQVINSNASRVSSHWGLPSEHEASEAWMSSPRLERMVKPDTSFASDASRSVCIDDDDDPFGTAMIENKSPISKYLEEEELEDGEDQEEQNLDNDDPEANQDTTAALLSVVLKDPSPDERRPERYDQLTLDHIVRASVVAEVKEAHAVRAIDLNSDGSQLVVGTNARALRIFDLVSSLSSASSTASSVVMMSKSPTRSSFSSPYRSFLPLLPVLVERHKHQLSPMASYHQHQDKVLQAQWPAIVTTGADKLVMLWAFS